MTDRELLEFAAKAAGLRINFHPTASYQWNPLERDDEALRLAVKLKIDLRLSFWKDQAEARTHIGAGRGIPLDRPYKSPVNDQREPYNGDPYAATRRAIVRAAAAIGKEMP